MTLPYRVSGAWLEERTLAGEMVQRDHEFFVQFDSLDPDLRDRARAVYLQTDPKRPGVVIGSGIERSDFVTTEHGQTGPAIWVEDRLGPIPKLPEPATHAAEVIAAYEAWLLRYNEQAPAVMREWVAEYGPGGALEAEHVLESPSVWQQTLPGEIVCYADRDPEAFRRARAARQVKSHADGIGDREDVRFADAVLGEDPKITFFMESDGATEVLSGEEEVLDAYEEHTRRWADLVLARAWTRQRKKDGFELEMLHWVGAHGSARLKLGIDDGYRMMPVYLKERIAVEAPGFYAHLPKDGEPKRWQLRTGPSEEALLLRRAVQDRLKASKSYMGTPDVEIGWMKDPPDAMADLNARIGYDGAGDPFARDEPFEVIVVPNWLDRYVLFAAVWTREEDQPAPYIRLGHVLKPVEYGLPKLIAPPKGPAGMTVRGAEEAERARNIADDDIPF